MLLGEGGADRFVFGDGDGHDSIFDLTLAGPDADLIDLTGVSGLTSAADVLALAVNFNTGVEFDFGGGDPLVLLGIQAEDLSEGLFLV